MGVDLVCAWCRRPFTAPRRRGPPPKYCSASHRQRAYEARAKAAAAEGRRGAKSPSRSGYQRMAITLLGTVDVIAPHGAAIALSPQLRAVVAALGARPRQVVSAESLSDAIWPGVEDGIARHRLQTAVWRLRALVSAQGAEDNIVRWSPPGYVLEVTDEQLDWKRFQRLCAAGAHALADDAPGLARRYLDAALSLWEEPGVLGGVDVPADALAFIAEHNALRDQAQSHLVEACFQLAEYHDAIPLLEARHRGGAASELTVRQLALAHHLSGQTARALEICNAFLQRDAAGVTSATSRVAELATAILQRDPALDDRAHGRRSRATRRDEQRNTPRALLTATWTRYIPAPAGPLPAELHVTVEQHGGKIYEATGERVEAAFATLGSAVAAALALQEPFAAPPLVRVGVEVAPGHGAEETLAELLRGRSRLLAAAARAGQILVSGAVNLDELHVATVDDVAVEDLGTHRLNAIMSPRVVFGIAVHGPPVSERPPAWFDDRRLENMPDEPFGFFGRDDDVRSVIGHLSATRITTLVGAPGTGKTRLAAQVATDVASEYPGGAWFVALASVSDAGEVPATLAEALGLPRRASTTLDVVVQWLRNEHVLIVLDNCEHLLQTCRDLAETVISACPGVTVLATSREALHSRLEHVVPLAPLPSPPLQPPDAVLQNPSVQLLIDRIGRPVEPEAAARICRAVEGIPLALVLAAARVHDLGAVVLGELLEEAMGEGGGLRLLSERSDDADPMHGTLGETVTWSYRLLPEEARELFDLLSVFRSAFTLDDAVAVGAAAGRSRDDIADSLRHLAQASLIETGLGSGRFRLLQPLRDYAAAKLAMRRDLAAAAGRRHAQHFVEMAAAAEPALHGAQDRATLAHLDAVLPDLYAATRWAVANRDSVSALRLVGYLWTFWLVRGRIGEGRHMLEAALALDRTPTQRRAKALLACSQMAWYGGDLARVHEACREAFMIAVLTADRWTWAWSALGLAAVDMFKADDDGVPQRILETLPMFRALGRVWDTGQALQTLGGAAWHRGDYALAEWAMGEALASYRSEGHPTLMGALFAHGLMLALLGDLERGAEQADQAIIATYEGGDLMHLGIALCHRAAIARYAGQHDESRRYYRDALRAARTAGQGWAMLWSLDGLGSTEGTDGSASRLAVCARLLAFAEGLSQQIGIALAPREREAHARDVAFARSRLGDVAFPAAFARGQGLTLDEAVELALDAGSAS